MEPSQISPSMLPEPSIQEQRQSSIWRNRDFVLLLNGQNVSTLGTNISVFALPLLVLALTHSPAQAGWLTALRQLPYLLLSLPAGALVDRWNRKRIMLICDAVRWVALGSVPLAFVLGRLTIIQLALVAFIEGSAYVFFSLAQISALPQIVEKPHLPQAYAFTTTTEYIGTLLGPTLGGLIVGLTPVVVIGACLGYLADCGSYLISLVSLLLMRGRFEVERTEERHEPLYREIIEGMRFLWQQPILRIMVILTTVVNFVMSPLTLIVIVLGQGTLHISVQALGILLSANGIGGVLGGIIAPWLHTRIRFGYACIGSVVLWSAATFLIALTGSPFLIGLGIGIVGLLWPIYSVFLLPYRAAVTPDHLQGRVNSAFRTFTYGSEPLGAALGGMLVVPLGPRPTLLIIAAVLLISSILVACTPLKRI